MYRVRSYLQGVGLDCERKCLAMRERAGQGCREGVFIITCLTLCHWNVGG